MRGGAAHHVIPLFYCRIFFFSFLAQSIICEQYKSSKKYTQRYQRSSYKLKLTVSGAENSLSNCLGTTKCLVKVIATPVLYIIFKVNNINLNHILLVMNWPAFIRLFYCRANYSPGLVTWHVPFGRSVIGANHLSLI